MVQCHLSGIRRFSTIHLLGIRLILDITKLIALASESNGSTRAALESNRSAIFHSVQYVDNDKRSGHKRHWNGVQWTIQGGSIIVNGTTFTITAGKGRMSNNDQLMMYGNATDSSGYTIRLHLEGLSAIYKGIVIVELNGRQLQ